MPGIICTVVVQFKRPLRCFNYAFQELLTRDFEVSINALLRISQLYSPLADCILLEHNLITWNDRPKMLGIIYGIAFYLVWRQTQTMHSLSQLFRRGV
jgi:hypothetical protein